MANQRKEFVLNPAEFDPERLTIHNPTQREINGGQGTYVTSDVTYRNDEGEECNLYFLPPTQNVFGVNPNWPMSVKAEERNDSNIKDYQIGYPMTSLKTLNSPTSDEKALMDLFDGISSAISEKYQQMSEEDKEVVDSASRTFLDRGVSGVKKLYAHPRKVDPSDPKGKRKIPDHSKPARSYIKLITRGKEPKRIIASQFYGPGDKLVNPLIYRDRPGLISPCISFGSVYWGPHGKSPNGASAQLKLVQANFVPSSFGLPVRRMIPTNSAPPTEDDEFYVAPSGEEKARELTKEEKDDFEEGAASTLERVAEANTKNIKKPTPALARPVPNTGKTNKPSAKPKQPAIKKSTQPVAEPVAKPKVAAKKAARAPKVQETEEEPAEE